jgi:ppGpp synthetase/RelA/SpoT-type nucleotidyltranferase
MLTRRIKVISEQSLSTYDDATKEILARARDDIHFFLNKRLQDCPQPEISRIYASSRLSFRVKPYESLLRKIRRDNIDNIEDIPTTIEDPIGFRISTPNKVQARELFDWFQSEKDKWFCKAGAEPKFVPYTLEDRNKYSLKTGYQSYHITFVFERGFVPYTNNRHWPCEIQVMSQVWEFWANYSRSYFYGNSGANVAQLLPYNVAISRILDSADDLMVATSELLLKGESDPKKEQAEDQTGDTSQPCIITAEAVRTWLEKNIAYLFSEKIKIPNELFLTKIANELNIYGISLDKLGEILRDESVIERYRTLLSASNLSYLPLYQQILCMILLYLQRDIRKIVERVNSELLLLGIRLQVFESGT